MNHYQINDLLEISRITNFSIKEKTRKMYDNVLKPFLLWYRLNNFSIWNNNYVSQYINDVLFNPKERAILMNNYKHTNNIKKQKYKEQEVIPILSNCKTKSIIVGYGYLDCNKNWIWTELYISGDRFKAFIYAILFYWKTQIIPTLIYDINIHNIEKELKIILNNGLKRAYFYENNRLKEQGYRKSPITERISIQKIITIQKSLWNYDFRKINSVFNNDYFKLIEMRLFISIQYWNWDRLSDLMSIQLGHLYFKECEEINFIPNNTTIGLEIFYNESKNLKLWETHTIYSIRSNEPENCLITNLLIYLWFRFNIFNELLLYNHHEQTSPEHWSKVYLFHSKNNPWTQCCRSTLYHHMRDILSYNNLEHVPWVTHLLRKSIPSNILRKNPSLLDYVKRRGWSKMDNKDSFFKYIDFSAPKELLLLLGNYDILKPILTREFDVNEEYLEILWPLTSNNILNEFIIIGRKILFQDLISLWSKYPNDELWIYLNRFIGNDNFNKFKKNCESCKNNFDY